jgi:nucleoside-diphosphate-sugar epimerase
MNVIITGASGFVGTHLCQFLQTLDCKVFSVGRNEVSDVKHYSITNDFCLSEIREILKETKPDYVFHLAGSVQEESLSEQYNINVNFAANLLEAIALEKLDQNTKILFVGSAAEYGYVSEDLLPVKETCCANPLNHYGVSKLTQTRMAMAWSNQQRKILVVRPFTILGKNMPTYLAIGSFIEQIKKIRTKGGKGILQTGNLDVARDFLSVNDVIKIFWKLINNNKAYGRVINVCEGSSTLLSEIVEYSIKQSNCEISLESTIDRQRKNDMNNHFGDNQLLKQLIGNINFTSWQETINTMLESK